VPQPILPQQIQTGGASWTKLEPILMKTPVSDSRREEDSNLDESRVFNRAPARNRTLFWVSPHLSPLWGGAVIREHPLFAVGSLHFASRFPPPNSVGLWLARLLCEERGSRARQNLPQSLTRRRVRSRDKRVSPTDGLKFMLVILGVNPCAVRSSYFGDWASILVIRFSIVTVPLPRINSWPRRISA